jgi:hypothetical protein
MERAGVLINRLKEQLQQQASLNNMLVTIEMLKTELLQQEQATDAPASSRVSVFVPNAIHLSPTIPTQQEYKPVPAPEPEPEIEPVEKPPTAPEPTPHPGPRPEPEPSIPSPSFAEGRPWQDLLSVKSSRLWPSDPVMEVPTLAHQDKVYFELNDAMSEKEVALNEKLKEEKAEMASVLQEFPIRDLKKAISINERHRFIHELFRGDETMYERSIKTINGFSIYAEAEYWIQRELKLKVGWDASLESVKVFDQLVKRRFA